MTSNPHEIAQRLHAAFGSNPFTPRQAMAAGISPRGLGRAVDKGNVSSLLTGTYLARADTEPVDWIRAALLVVDHATVSHESAAHLWHLPSPRPFHLPVTVTRPGIRYRRTPGIRAFGSPLPAHHTAEVDGIPVTSLARTAIDIARRYRTPRALIIMDAAMRQLVQRQVGSIERELRVILDRPGVVEDALRILVGHLAAQRGWPGIRKARTTLGHVDARSESPLESFSRGTLVSFGIPRPECGVAIVGDDGQTYWVDMFWRAWNVIGECDGMNKYDDPGALRREKNRQEALENAGYIVVRWTWTEISTRPHQVARRLHAASERAKRLGLAG